MFWILFSFSWSVICVFSQAYQLKPIRKWKTVLGVAGDRVIDRLLPVSKGKNSACGGGGGKEGKLCR